MGEKPKLSSDPPSKSQKFAAGGGGFGENSPDPYSRSFPSIYSIPPTDWRFGTQNLKVPSVLIFPVLGTCCISLRPLLRLLVLIPMHRRAVLLSPPCNKALHRTYLFIFCRAGGTCPDSYAVTKVTKATVFKFSHPYKVLGLTYDTVALIYTMTALLHSDSP